MTPLTPALDEMCAAIWEADSEEPWARVIEFSNAGIAWYMTAREATIRQATAALALAEKRERALREALEDEDNRASTAIKILLDLAAAVYFMCDDSEDRDEEHAVQHEDFKKVCDLLDALDDLPDDQPGYTMGPAAKASWSLRHIVAALAAAREAMELKQ